MRSIIRYVTMTVVASMLMVSAAIAGECCDKSAAAAKEGKACVKCVKHDCCKQAIKKLGDEAKPDACTKKKGG